MLAGDDVAAAKILQVYFATQFIDQVAKSGEQPFEAVRTRPYHYRCFNLEAMIVSLWYLNFIDTVVKFDSIPD